MALRNYALSVQKLLNSKMAEEGEFSFSYLGYYQGLVFFASFLLYLKNIPLFEATSRKTEILHTQMIEKVIKAPVNIFFDRVPIGRILQRFTGDLPKLGSNTGIFFSWVVYTIFEIISGYIMYAYLSSAYIIPFIVLFFWISQKYKHEFVKVSREVERLSNGSFRFIMC
jgi:ABC-type multidrug transport system fused ATPase/permease subunit